MRLDKGYSNMTGPQDQTLFTCEKVIIPRVLLIHYYGGLVVMQLLELHIPASLDMVTVSWLLREARAMNTSFDSTRIQA